MAFLKSTRFLTTAALGLAGSLALASTAQAGFLSSSGNTYMVRDGQKYYYSSDIDGERFTGTISGYYNVTGAFIGRFTDYSTNGEGCSGRVARGENEKNGIRELYFDVDRAAPNHSCNSIGTSFSVAMESMGRNADSAMLWANTPNKRIPLYEGVMDSIPTKSYGVRGDRVTLVEPIPIENRFRVTFSSGATGWVDVSNVIEDR